MCPSFSVYYNGVTPAGIVIKSVARPAATGFVRCPPITCPLPPYGKLGLFVPLLQTKQERLRMHLGAALKIWGIHQSWKNVTYTINGQILSFYLVATLVGWKHVIRMVRQGQGRRSHVVLHKSDDITRVTSPEAITHLLSQVVSRCKSSTSKHIAIQIQNIILWYSFKKLLVKVKHREHKILL